MVKARTKSGEIIRKLRKEFNIKQKELICEGIKNVSRLEIGECDVTPAVARLLSDRFNFLVKEKDLKIKYEITDKLILGETKYISNDILKQISELGESITDNHSLFIDVDNYINNYDLEHIICFILDLLFILNEQCYLLPKSIKKYCYKLLVLDLNLNDKLRAYYYLIRAHNSLNEYESIIAIGEVVKTEFLKTNDDELKEKFFGNFSLAYYELKLYKECINTLNYIKKYSNIKTELFYLNLYGISYKKINNIKDANKIFLNIINISTKNNNNNYLVNTFSNLADLYLNIDLNMSIEYINQAYNLINDKTEKMYLLNFHYYYYSILVKRNKLNEAYSQYISALKLSNEIHAEDFKELLILSYIETFKNTNSITSIIKLLIKDITEFNININSTLFFKIINLIEINEDVIAILKSAQL